MQKILIVDDESKIRRLYRSLLTAEGFEVFEAEKSQRANEILNKEEVDLILLDLALPDFNGDQLHKKIKKKSGKPKVIVASVYSVDKQRIRIPDADGYFDKSEGTDVLLSRIESVFRSSGSKAKALHTIPLFWPFISDKVVDAISEVLKTRWVGEGPLVRRVEETFQSMFKIPHAVAVNSCTSALHLAYILAGVHEGDEVITTPLTCYATVTPVLYQKAKPVFADIIPGTLNIDPISIHKKITNKTKAIVVVHWGGDPCNMDEIGAIARERGIPIIEDAAHALGATYHERPIGGLSDFTCFSFQAIKHITTADGGMLATLSKERAEKAGKLRWYGIDRNFHGDLYEKFKIEELGYKYHMNDLTAAMLLAQLEDLQKVLNRRKQIVDRYRDALKEIDGIELLWKQNDRESANWLFNVLVDRRDDFQKKLASKGIETSLVHVRLDVYPILGGNRQNLPGMDQVEPRYLALPLHNHLTDEDVEFVIQTIREGW